MRRALVGGCLVAATVAGCARPGSAARDVMPAAAAVVQALDARDAAALARWVHPVKGLRFSPYPYVRADSDVVLPPADVARAFSDSTPRLWGHQDGSGDPMRWTFNRYYGKFVYDVPFSTAPVVRANQPPARPGNSPSNLRETYPGAEWVEYHFPGFDAKYGGMDWRSLWLVFERDGDQWRLVGLVHGSWTI